MSDTPRTDAAEKHAYDARQLEHELAEAREHLKRTFEELYETQQSLGLKTGQVTLVTMQRDRLAEALEKLIRLDDQMNDPDYEESGTYAGAYYCYYKGERDTWDNAREALAAVKGEEPVDPHKYCRGGGGDNFHCGCKYDAQNHESYYP
jgi:hypothetical protein